MEIWKTIEGFEDYQVSTYGNVKSFKNGKEKFLKQSISANYYHLELFKNGIGINKKVHQLVAIAFLNHKPNGKKLVVNHINFNKQDNRIDNLEIITMRENSNLKRFKSSSEYVGVHLIKKSNKWCSRIWINGKRKHLGLFNSEIEAHNAYQNALLNL